jgi:putative transposase
VKQNYSVNRICDELKVSRQYYYKAKKKEEEQALHELLIIDLVKDIRKRLPCLGSKKLYYKLRNDLELLGSPGRDKFIEILRKNDLLIRRKRKYAVTTNSHHNFYKYGNLIKELKVTEKDHVYVCDITYIRLRNGFCYLSLVTDLYSKKIVGYYVCESLSLEGSLNAIKKAVKLLGQDHKLIHHSDRGIQYCSSIYINYLKKLNIQISMGEKGNPYENAVAERINGILKQEFMLDETFNSLAEVREIVKESVRLYNDERPHLSNKYLTPNEKYEGKVA